MVDVAKFFLDFTLDESCGKCTPCRVGGTQMFRILDRITKGEGALEDIDLLKSLSTAMKSASLCGLGMTAPNPVLATLDCFEDEYREHIVDKKCKAHRCSPLITYSVVEKDCTGCTLCARACPVNCISGDKKEVHFIDQSRCISCGACFEKCNFNAIKRS
jgi:NADP-reducing hydrogenase subunit HndC